MSGQTGSPVCTRDLPFANSSGRLGDLSMLVLCCVTCPLAHCRFYLAGMPRLAELDARVADLRVNALAPSTRRTYLVYVGTYLGCCDSHRIVPLPVSATHLGRYIAYLSFRLTFSSIRNYLSAVRLLHLEGGFPTPVYSYCIRSMVKGARLLQCVPLPPAGLFCLYVSVWGGPSGHSFRRGGASFALACGVSTDLIQSQGDWRSDA